MVKQLVMYGFALWWWRCAGKTNAPSLALHVESCWQIANSPQATAEEHFISCKLLILERVFRTMTDGPVSNAAVIQVIQFSNDNLNLF